MENKLNSGAIFKNEKKNEKAPDYKGKINVEGKEFEIALWVKEGKRGKFFSASVQPPYQSTGISTAKRPYENLETKDNLPF